MNFVQITPGAGKMYCGNCFRDNALVRELRRLGHSTLMVPLYLPLTLDEPDQSAGEKIHFNGINVYLEQKSAFFRNAPAWLHDALASPALLELAAGMAAKTRPADVGDLTLSMIQGEEGNQARELEELIAFLQTQPRPDAICLSNAMLIGLTRRLRAAMRAPVVCVLQGEDAFLDALPAPWRTSVWETMAERAREVDLFVAPTRYFADRMQQRLRLSADRVRVVPNGIALEGYPETANAPAGGPPVLGYFARMCREKGVDTLVDAYILLRQRGRIKDVKLRLGGGCGPADEPLVRELKQRLQTAGLLGEVEFHPNLTRDEKLAFLRSLTVFSVPACYGEAFGLYLIEALAAGVPVVQPDTASFPELLAATGGGVLCQPGNAAALAEAIEALLLEPARARALGEAGRLAVREKFSIAALAGAMVEVFRDAANRNPHPATG